MKENIDTSSLAHTSWNCKYHIVFAPKYRRKVFYEEKRLEIRFIDCVSSYDVQLFSSFVVDEKPNQNAIWKKYISSVTANLCDTDAEVAAYMLDKIDVKNDSPLDIIVNTSDCHQYEKRGANPHSNHVFSYARRGDVKELEKRLWKAQIQILFPIIEMERISIIEQYECELKDALENNYIEQYRVQITKPIELELGTLCYMMGTCLYIKDKEMRERIKFLHTCRNHLAHAHCCSTEEVRQLLDK